MAYVRKSKDPDAVLDYIWDWSAELGDDTIDTASFTVTTQQGGVIPDGDTTPAEVDTFSWTETTATAWISGGTVGHVYLIVCHIESAGERQDDKTLQLKIAQK